MGRRRVIDREAVLDAAERVVGRVGAANLTLDDVACEAGISKAGVLYDVKTKQALLEAVVARAFRRDTDRHADYERMLTAEADIAIKGRIAAAAEPPQEEFRTIALNLTAALVIDPSLRRQMQDQQATTIGRVLRESTRPRSALLAYLALEGLKFLEYLDFHRFGPDERRCIVGEIADAAVGGTAVVGGIGLTEGAAADDR